MFNKSWLRFLQQVEEEKESLGFLKNEECFYRGHPLSQYKLLPSLYRPQSKKLSRKELWEIESDLFYEFRARAKEVHEADLSDWDILFYMQHHGARTRLLDWTESFGVALYFALLDYKPAASPCIWILNPYKLNENFLGGRDLYAPENLNNNEEESYSDYLLYKTPAKIWWNEPVAIYPIRRVDRLTTQGGYFTIHGRDTRPVEQIVPARKKILAKVELPKEAIESAFLFLEQAGIHHFTMFPDLDGLARFLNQKYFNQ